jgi:hypothetical protein
MTLFWKAQEPVVIDAIQYTGSNAQAIADFLSASTGVTHSWTQYSSTPNIIGFSVPGNSNVGGVLSGNWVYAPDNIAPYLNGFTTGTYPTLNTNQE